MSEEDISHIIHKVQRLRELGKNITIFLGAGASKSAGIPTSRGIVEHIKESESLSPFLDGISTDDYFEIMSGLDPGERYRILNHLVENAQINQTHFIVGLLTVMGYMDCIVTTNFDPLAKRALILLLEDLPIYDVPNNIDLSLKQINLPAIFHLHGELENVWQINTLEKLEKESSKIKSILTRTIQERALIIVGYSGSANDPVFKTLCSFDKFDEGLYWIGYKDNEPSQLVREKLLSDKTKNVHYLSGYDSDEFFVELFDSIIPQPTQEIANYLRTVKSAIQGRIELTEKLAGDSGQKLTDFTQAEIKIEKQIKLTANCEGWIDQLIKKSETIKFQPEPLNIFSKVLSYIAPTFYYEQNVLNHTKLLLNNNNYKVAADFLSGEINESDGKNPFYLYYYAVAIAEVAQSLYQPLDRKEIYQEVVQSLSKAKKYFEKLEYKPDELNRIEPILKVIWSKEHNRAVELATDEDLKNTISEPLKKAIQHLQNATVIQPNSALSWGVLAQVSAMYNDFEQAVSAKERQMSIMPDSAKEKNDFIVLAQYYYQLDEQENVLKTLESASGLFPEDGQIVSNLADTYTRLGQSEMAIETVLNLVEKNPDNPQYRLSYATQIYQKALGLRESVVVNNNKIQNLRSQSESQSQNQQISALEQENQQMQTQIDELTDQAEGELNKTLKYRPDDDAAYNVLGAIYQNRAKDKFEERNRTTQDHEKAAELDKQGKGLLRQSMNYYEEAANIDPNNQSYWRSLFQIYDALGMDQKANIASRKAGIK